MIWLRLIADILFWCTIVGTFLWLLDRAGVLW